VPEISRFFGIIVRMFMEAGAAHHTPHFHAYYQEHVGVFSIDPIESAPSRYASNSVMVRGRLSISRRC
jgi:hypothetical protein